MFRRFDNCMGAPMQNEIDIVRIHGEGGCSCGQRPCTCRREQPHTMPMGPIVEAEQVRIEHRDIVHNVEHICPIKTKVVNHHIYKHSYRPCYETVCEEQVSHVGNNGCCKF